MTTMLTLADRYREACETPSDIVDHLPRFVALVEELDATTVIELGTRAGVSTVAWLYALEGRGRLWSVDRERPPALGNPEHWTFLLGDDCSQGVFERLPASVDIVFIDTSHAYNHTATELALYRWLVRPGGVIVLHDTELEQPFDLPYEQPFPVKRAVEDFCKAEGLEWENDPRCFGLGIIRL